MRSYFRCGKKRIAIDTEQKAYSKYSDPDEFERWIKTVSRGQWTDEQAFQPGGARRGIWRKKT